VWIPECSIVSKDEEDESGLEDDPLSGAEVATREYYRRKFAISTAGGALMMVPAEYRSMVSKQLWKSSPFFLSHSSLPYHTHTRRTIVNFPNIDLAQHHIQQSTYLLIGGHLVEIRIRSVIEDTTLEQDVKNTNTSSPIKDKLNNIAKETAERRQVVATATATTRQSGATANLAVAAGAAASSTPAARPGGGNGGARPTSHAAQSEAVRLMMAAPELDGSDDDDFGHMDDEKTRIKAQKEIYQKMMGDGDDESHSSSSEEDVPRTRKNIVKSHPNGQYMMSNRLHGYMFAESASKDMKRLERIYRNQSLATTSTTSTTPKTNTLTSASSSSNATSSALAKTTLTAAKTAIRSFEVRMYVCNTSTLGANTFPQALSQWLRPSASASEITQLAQSLFNAPYTYHTEFFFELESGILKHPWQHTSAYNRPVPALKPMKLDLVLPSEKIVDLSIPLTIYAASISARKTYKCNEFLS